jgi:hypothetical protein
MNRRRLIFTIITIAVVLIGILVLLRTQNVASTTITYAELEQQASHEQTVPDCLNEKLTNVPDGVQAALSDAVDREVTHRPRTTAFGIQFASYTSSKVTGVIMYDGEANNFNFVATQDGGVWKINDVMVCATH